MLSASSRRLRCYRAAQLCARILGPDSAPILNPIKKCMPSNPVGESKNRPLFSIVSRFITNSQASSAEEEELVVNRILSSIENAPTLLESLHEKRVFLSPKAYNRVLVAASERNDLQLVCEIVRVATGSSQRLNSTCYLTVANAFAKTDGCDELLLRLTKQVLELTSPSLTVINQIIFAFGECRETDKALVIFTLMKALNFAPDLYTYNTILEILGRAGRRDEMLSQFGSMKEAGIDPDVVSYNTILNNLRKFGKFDMCLLYLKEMGENGVQPDLLTYTAVMESLGRSGNVEESMRLLDEMKARRIRPSLYMYRALISNLKKMGKVELAMSFQEEMNSCASKLAGPMDFKRNKRK